MKTRIVLIILIAATVGVSVYTRPHNALPSDLRDAPNSNASALGQLDTSGRDGGGSLPVPVPARAAKDGFVAPAKLTVRDVTGVVAKLQRPAPPMNYILAHMNGAGFNANACVGRYASDMVFLASERSFQSTARDLAGYDFIADILVTRDVLPGNPKMTLLGDGTWDFIVVKLAGLPPVLAMEAELRANRLSVMTCYDVNREHFLLVLAPNNPPALAHIEKTLSGYDFIREIEMNQRLYSTLKSNQY